jgi:hypothetical protein
MLLNAALVLASLAGLAHGHICVLDPPQRGNLSVVTPGDPSCYRRTVGAVTGLPASPTPKYYVSGQTAAIRFQQNLNHFNMSTPGRIDLYFEGAGIGRVALATVGDWPAHDMVMQTNYTVEITVPQVSAATPALLWAVYTSYNNKEIDPSANTDAVFFNAADVVLIPTPASAKAGDEATVSVTKDTTKDTAAAAAAVPNFDCVTPPSWKGMAIETTQYGVVEHSIQWDHAHNRSRWARAITHRDGSTEAYVVINDYNKGIEYVINPNVPSCDLYGCDLMYPWGFGSQYNMRTIGTSFSGRVHSWQIGTLIGASFTFTAESAGDGLCLPVSIATPSSTMTFVTVEIATFTDADFKPAPWCKTPKSWHHSCQKIRVSDLF